VTTSVAESHITTSLSGFQFRLSNVDTNSQMSGFEVLFSKK